MSQPQKAQRPYIEVHLSDGRIESFELTRARMTIGRSEEADIVIPEPLVSRIHAKIKRTRQGRWIIVDLGSRNKTFLNDRRIKAHLLNNNDSLHLAQVPIVFHDPTGASDAIKNRTVYDLSESAPHRRESLEETMLDMDLEAEAPERPFAAQPAGPSHKAQSVNARRANPPDAMLVPAGRTSTLGLASQNPFADTLAPYTPTEQPKTSPAVPFLQTLLRYKWTVFAVFLLIAVPAVTAIWTLIVPVYRAKAEVRVRPIIPRLVFNTGDNGLIPFYNSYMNTQVSVIRSPDVIRRVLDQPEVQNTSWYKQDRDFPFYSQASRMERLWKALEVRPRGRTEIIDVSMTARNPADAAIILDAVLAQYMNFINTRSEKIKDQVYRELTAQERSLREEIEGREQAVARLTKELGTGTPDDLVSHRRVRLDELEAQLRDLRRQIAKAKWQENELAALVEQHSAEAEQAAQPQAWYEDDAEWRRLYDQFRKAKLQVDLQKDRLGKAHPKMIELNEKLKLAEEMLHAREKQLSQKWDTTGHLLMPAGQTANQAKNLYMLRQSIKTMEYEQKLLAEDIAKEKAKFERTFDVAMALIKENKEIRHKQDIYKDVRTALDHKDVERNRPGSIEILANAIVPSEPYRDRRLLLSAMAVFLGLSAGFVVAYLRANVSQSIDEVSDLSQTVSAPFLGQLLLVRDTKRADQYGPVQGEFIRMIRTALLQRINGEKGDTILITSAESGAGKTTVAVMLAKSLAQCGKNVLLIDADLRNPNISEQLGVEAEPGLLGSLSPQTPDERTIVRTDIKGLSVLPAGNCQNITDPELLADGVFETCLNRWRGRFDIIILDSPPVLPVADARILARHADGTIMVIREGHCRRSDVVDALAYLGVSGAKLLGTVFIGSTRRSGAYKSKYYNNYYSAYTNTQSTAQ